MEWTAVTALIAVVGLFATVGAPVIKLNSNITRLNVTLEQLKQDMAQQKLSAKETHTRLWRHNDAQDEQIKDHEKRITILERKQEGSV